MKSFFVNISLMACGLLFAFAAGEVGIRVYEANAPKVVKKDDRPLYYYKPAGTDSWANPPLSVDKPPDTFRVAAIGDSFTFPHLLQFDDAYPKRLERILNLNNGPLKAQVLNFGISGLCTIQEVKEFFRALKYSPDLLILEVTINDIDCHNFHRLIKAGIPGYTLGKLRVTKKNHPLLYYSRFLRLIAERIHNKHSQSSFVQFDLDLYKSKKLWKAFKKSIRQMQASAKDAGVPFAVFIMPFFHFPLDKHYPFLPIHKKLDHFFTKTGLPFIDLLDTFRGMDHRRLQVLPGSDSHPNEISHRIEAEKLYEWLEGLDLIPAELRLKERFKKRFSQPGA